MCEQRRSRLIAAWRRPAPIGYNSSMAANAILPRPWVHKATESRRGSPGTREHLLEAAGHVFAHKGFERTTAKEICELARTNTAAVNYYFGGIESLYAALMEEARNRIFRCEKSDWQSPAKTIPSRN